jgi:hypothetical protein
MPVGPAPAIKTGFKFSFIVVSLLSKPVFEMFLTLESQPVGTKPTIVPPSKYAIRWCNMGAIRQERTLAASR